MHNFVLFCFMSSFFVQFECGHLVWMLQSARCHLSPEVVSGHFANLTD